MSIKNFFAPAKRPREETEEDAAVDASPNKKMKTAS
jgi:hypothetical protein